MARKEIMGNSKGDKDILSYKLKTPSNCVSGIHNPEKRDKEKRPKIDEIIRAEEGSFIVLRYS